MVYTIKNTAIDGNDVVRKGFDHWLEIVRDHLERMLPGQIKERIMTSRSLQFKFDDYIDVDILMSPFWREPKKLYMFLQQITPENRSQ